jgi:hypothetical protein
VRNTDSSIGSKRSAPLPAENTRNGPPVKSSEADRDSPAGVEPPAAGGSLTNDVTAQRSEDSVDGSGAPRNKNDLEAELGSG